MTAQVKKRNARRWTALLAGAVLVFSSATALASPAFADAYNGVLGIYGVGSVYAGTDASGLDGGAYVTRSVAPAGTASFAIEVVNTGTVLAQYQVNIANQGAGIPVLKAGSTDVTSLALASAPHGYETVSVAPGKATTLTLTVKVPKTALPSDQFLEVVSLWGPGQDVYLGTVYAATQISSSTGTAANTITASSSGQPAVSGADTNGQRPWMAAATIKGTAVATYSLTLKNGSTAPATLTLYMAPTFACSQASFVTTVKISSTLGSVDITSAAFSDAGYKLPALAKGASKTVTVTVKIGATPPDLTYCANVQAYTADVTANGNQFNGVALIADAV